MITPVSESTLPRSALKFATHRQQRTTAPAEQRPHLEGVYRRTAAGHHEAVTNRGSLDAAERSLLLMVTGLTPLGVLIARPTQVSDPIATATKLMAIGLIEPVPEDTEWAPEPTTATDLAMN